MNWQLVETYARDTWAVVGPLIGVLIGAYIADRNQRERWIADNKKEEYRELLSVISKSLATAILAKGNVIPKGLERDKVIATTWSNVTETIYNRIFIARQMDELSVLSRWIGALQHIIDGGPDAPFVAAVNVIMSDVRASARKEMMSEDSVSQNVS